MGIIPRFTVAGSNRRPFGAHRHDVYSPKLHRQLTLYGRNAVNLWVTLEATPHVLSFCERPLLVPDCKPPRCVDFWVQRAASEEFLVLRGASDADDEVERFATQSIQGIPVRVLDSDQMANHQTRLTNWGWIIRDLAAFERFIPEPCCAEVLATLGPGKTIAQIQQDISQFDGSTVKLAIFSLLHRGLVVCNQLVTEELGPDHRIEAA